MNETNDGHVRASYFEMTARLNDFIYDQDFLGAKAMLYSGAVPDALSFEFAAAYLPSGIFLLLEFGVPVSIPSEQRSGGGAWSASRVFETTRLLNGADDYTRRWHNLVIFSAILEESWARERRGIVAGEYLRDHCPFHPHATLAREVVPTEAEAARERLRAKHAARRSAGIAVGASPA